MTDRGFWPERTDPQGYEQACLERARLGLNSPFLGVGKAVEDVYLRGDYPNTELVVVLLYDGSRREVPFPLWSDTEFGTVGERGRASPELVGDDVKIAIMEL